MAGAQAERAQMRAIDFIAGRCAGANQASMDGRFHCARGSADGYAVASARLKPRESETWA
jgi:hypothetical protein